MSAIWVVLLTFVEMLKLLCKLCHVLLKLDPLFLFVVVFGKGLKVNFWNFFILAVEFIQLEHGVGLTLRVWGVVAEFVSLSMLLSADLVALLTKTKVKILATVNSYIKRQSEIRLSKDLFVCTY